MSNLLMPRYPANHQVGSETLHDGRTRITHNDGSVSIQPARDIDLSAPPASSTPTRGFGLDGSKKTAPVPSASTPKSLAAMAAEDADEELAAESMRRAADPEASLGEMAKALAANDTNADGCGHV